MSEIKKDGPRWPRRWPLALLAFPAGVATWSGWVGLGEKTGFGPVVPLPGIVDDFVINSAIALPIGVEAYAAYALAAWLTSAPISAATRSFARWSAFTALALGMLGQTAYHLLEVEGQATAPPEITITVSCLPVMVLGAGAALAHLLHRDKREWTARASEASEAPKPLPALPPAPSPTAPDPGPEVDAVWASMSDADKIRIAASVLRKGDRYPSPKEVVAWLSRRGHEVKESNARTVLRRERAKAAASSDR